MSPGLCFAAGRNAPDTNKLIPAGSEQRLAVVGIREKANVDTDSASTDVEPSGPNANDGGRRQRLGGPGRPDTGEAQTPEDDAAEAPAHFISPRAIFSPPPRPS